jgi:hypothetical protein
MKRDRHLRGLSDKHHHALVLAHRLSTHDATADDLQRLGTQFDLELEPHFALEEEMLFAELRRLGEGALVDRALNDHAFLREHVSAARGGDPIAVRAFANRLQEHVRFEERELLPRCESLFTREALERIEQRAPRET